MPRIDAPTVAEHHQMRRDSLLAAGADILATAGPSGLTHSALGEAAGIARTSVYQYFPSRDELIQSVIDQAFAAAQAHLTAAVSHEADPLDRVVAYVTHSLARASDATHSAFAVISGDLLSEANKHRLDELHRAVITPLRDALTELGVPDPSLTASFVDGMVQAAARRVLAGDDLETVTPALVAAVVRGPLVVA